MVFLGNYMIITGGRTKNIQENLTTEVYDTETSEWKRFSGLNLFRHSCFVKNSFLYIYGGFENTNPNIPIEKLIKIDLNQYFISNPTILAKLEAIIANLNNTGGDKKSQDKDSNSNILLKNNNMILDNNSKQDQKFRLANQAVVAKFNVEDNENLGLIRKVSIDKLNDESKRKLI